MMSSANPRETLVARIHSDFQAARDFLGKCHVAPTSTNTGGFVTETEQVLRSRLRSAATILCIGFTLFLSVYIDPHLAPTWELILFHVGLAVITGACAYLLDERFGWKLTQLRVFEYLLFGLSAAFFTYLQCREMAYISEIRDTNQRLPILATTSTHLLIPWVNIVLMYSVFIPNTWQRCAAHVIPAAMVPIIVYVIGCWWVPGGSDFLASRVMLEMVLWAAVPTLTAVFGAHTLNTLRRRAAMAKELGSYHLKQSLGAGGMGEVYLGEHKLLKRPCAIKLIRASKATDPLAIARFEREVQATAKLTHWNTIEIFDYGHTEDGTFYYVMEYLPGMSLQDLIDRHGPMPPERAIHFLRQVCDGLREAHTMGLIHRDIKPGNIFATYRGAIWDVAKLLDFGLVKSIARDKRPSESSDGLVVGTPLFAAPEWTLRDGQLDERSDIYSLGAVGYFLLTGRPVFTHKSAVKLLFAHANEPVAPPRDFDPRIPEEIERVILRCLAKRPEDRFASVEELAEALDRCPAAGTWTQARAAGWWNSIDVDRANSSQIASDPSALTQVLEVSELV
jgi:eukaryotic-like serine/threonine-protein kinase